MCGISGFLTRGGLARGAEEDLTRMVSALTHRGPDAGGVWTDTDAGVALGHRRLAVVDVSAHGAQPMTSASGRFVISFNGEIYNHGELRRLAERNGVDVDSRVASPLPWRGRSDTEVLLACIDLWGVERAVTRLTGMFAFALWDRALRRLTLARDRMGEKPLYYGWYGDSLLFGSELKALRAHRGFSPAINRDAVSALMQFCYVPTPMSIYDGVLKLPPGTLLTVSSDRTAATPVSYWSLAAHANAGVRREMDFEESAEELERLLGTVVEQQYVADVPVGAFLSGGVDSSLLVALLRRRLGKRVDTFTIGFDDRRFDESEKASRIASHLGTHHSMQRVSARDVLDVIPRLPTIFDEPFADSSQLPAVLVSRMARRSVTVSLTGDGGDELFGGYNRHRWANQLSRVPLPLRRWLSAALVGVRPSTWDRWYGSVEQSVPTSLRQTVVGDKVQKMLRLASAQNDFDVYAQLVSTWTTQVEVSGRPSALARVEALWNACAAGRSMQERMMIVDALTYLPDDILCKVDRAGMSVALETRMPFLDHRVVEYAYQMPLEHKIVGSQGKRVLRHILGKYVPSYLTDGPKTGFGVPIDEWLRGSLRDWGESLLDEQTIRQQGFLDATIVRERWRQHLDGKRNWQQKLWVVLMFQAWLFEHGC